MRKNYSRLASVEERKNVRSAFLFVILTIVTIALLFFVGIPLLGKFTAFISDLAKSNKEISGGDTTPPAPPRFNTFPEFTNNVRVTISGNVEAGVTVKVAFNGREQEGLSDKDGNFSFDFPLNDQNNNFSGIAIDGAGNMSHRTKDYKITFDNKVPELTIDKPADGAQFFGSKQKQVTIEGKTDAGTEVSINDRVVQVADDGKFVYTTTLNDGENIFNTKSVDQAGNITEKSLTLTFSL